MALANGSLNEALTTSSLPEHKAMTDRIHKLPVAHHSPLLRLALSSVYDTPREFSSKDLAVMRRIAELHLEYQPSVSDQLSPRSELK